VGSVKGEALFGNQTFFAAIGFFVLDLRFGVLSRPAYFNLRTKNLSCLYFM
jgi:hypothetical protein